ncbi:MAG: hypothetical protein HRU00_11650, partial [Myxococcales bacterium]|nr:hypothetical protein [Myxococcales bacterium]
ERGFYGGLVESLLKYVELTTRLGKKDDKGVSLKEHLEVAKAAGADPRELRELPDLCSYTRRLWAIFLDLRSSTNSGFNGPNRIDNLSIRAYLLNCGVKINKRELKVLTLMDSKYLEVVNVG